MSVSNSVPQIVLWVVTKVNKVFFLWYFGRYRETTIRTSAEQTTLGNYEFMVILFAFFFVNGPEFAMVMHVSSEFEGIHGIAVCVWHACCAP